MLNELLARLGALPEAEQKAVTQDAVAATKGMVWVPNLGPQTEAFFCEADELYYGGEAGGGKTDLLIGLALTAHSDSLILRRFNDDAKDVAKRAREIAGDNEESYNGQDRILKVQGRQVRFSGCQFEEDKERFKGRAKDFYGFDEGADFTETQFKFITTWNRSTKPGQRCRVVVASNPPTRPEGLWIKRYWAAWLDKKHPNPAKPGELRWYIRGENDEDVEVDGRGPHVVSWSREPLVARSRTFIRSRLQDNPDLAATDYKASLDALPVELRRAYRDGDFDTDLKDEAFQAIPTDWITAAMERWRPDGFKEHLMTAMACDAAGGGEDAAEIVERYGAWFSQIETVKGKETADGSSMAARIVRRRRHRAPVVLDASGGYAGSYAIRLEDNGFDKNEIVLFKGAEGSTAKANDGSGLGFANKRAEAAWRLREALDPSQEGGSVVALPPDDELKADLAAMHWTLTKQGILIEPKDDIKKRIGRSPGKGDVVMMCLSEGDRAVKRAKNGRSGASRPVTANLGYAHLRKR